MNRLAQLQILHNACGGDPRMVAQKHIFNGREHIEPEDHIYLEEHADALTWNEHARRLACDPQNPQQLVDRIVQSFPPAEPGRPPMLFFLGNTMALCAKWYSPAVLDELANRLRPPRLCADDWWSIAQQQRYRVTAEATLCPSYVALVEAGASTLALRLFEYRRHEPHLLQALSGALQDDDAALCGRLLHEARAAGLLQLVHPREVLPGEIQVAGEESAGWLGRQMLAFALEWPRERAADARAWALDRLVAAAQGGLHPSHLWMVTPPDLRAALAFAAQDAGVLVPWLGAAVRDAMAQGAPDAWNRLFAWLDLPGALEPCHFVLHPAPGEKSGGLRVERDDLRSPGQIAMTLLFDAAPPPEADDAFEERLIERCRSVHQADRFAMVFLSFEQALLSRRATLPLTPARANRLLGKMVRQAAKTRLSMREPLARVAAAADPLPWERLPPADSIVISSEDTEGLALYRQIAGSHAEDGLRAWIGAPLAWAGGDDQAGSFRRDPFDEVLSRVGVLPDLVSPDVQAWLRREVQKQPTYRMFVLLERGELPWLLDEATVYAVALSRAETESEPWAWSEDPALPVALLPAVRRRVQSSAPEERELVALLRGLAAHDEPLGELFKTMLTRIRVRKPRHHALRWLAATLSSHARWRHHGRDTFLALMDASAWDEILELIQMVLRAQGTTADRHALVVVLHEAMARALIHVAERAIDRDACAEAIGALHALAALRPRTGLRGDVRHLGTKPNVSAEVRDLVALNAELLRRDVTREACDTDLTTALALLLEERGKVAKSQAAADVGT